jgi:hypothetical protein
MRALLLPLFYRSAWAQPATVVAGTTVDGAALASVRWLGLCQPATVVVGTRVEGASLISVRFIGEGSASHSGGGQDKRGRWSDLCSIGRRGIIQPLWWRVRQ